MVQSRECYIDSKSVHDALCKHGDAGFCFNIVKLPP